MSKYEDDRWDMPEGYYLPDELEDNGCAQLVFVALVLLLFVLSTIACYLWFTAGGSAGGLA